MNLLHPRGLGNNELKTSSHQGLPGLLSIAETDSDNVKAAGLWQNDKTELKFMFIQKAAHEYLLQQYICQMPELGIIYPFAKWLKHTKKSQCQEDSTITTKGELMLWQCYIIAICYWQQNLVLWVWKNQFWNVQI